MSPRIAFLIALFSAATATAEDYIPLTPKADAARDVREQIMLACPPFGHETSAEWNIRCVPEGLRQAGENIRIIDGDTIEVEGETIRLANVDAPEIRTAKCDAERMLGERAKADLEIVLKGSLKIKRVGSDKFGRTLGFIQILGGSADAGETLITMGIAVPYDGSRRKAWCTPTE